MESVPRGSDHVQADSKNRDCQDCYPVATALGTDDLMTQVVSVSNKTGVVYFTNFSLPPDLNLKVEF